MQRDLLLLAEMIDSAERAVELVNGVDSDGLAADRLRREALLWNFTVLGEASNAVSEATRTAHPELPGLATRLGTILAELEQPGTG